MIKVTDVKYGLMPYSAGVGQTAIGIYFEDDEEHYNFDGLDEAKDSETIQKMYADTAEQMYADIKKLVSDHGIEEEWNSGLSFEKGIYTVFIGDVCVDDEYFYPYNMLLTLISKESYDRQQMSEAFRKARAEKRMPRLAPPRFALVTKPTNPMVVKNPYEACNFVVAKLDVKGLTKENTESYYHINSIMNINKHPFGTFVFRPESIEDLNLFEQQYAKLPFEHKLQVYVVPAVESEDTRKAIQLWAIDHGYRVGASIESDLALSFND